MRWSARALLLIATFTTFAAARAPAANATAVPQPVPPRQAPAPGSNLTQPALVPLPAVVDSRPGDGFTIDRTTVITAGSADPAVQRTVALLSAWIQRSTGIVVPEAAPAAATVNSTIALALDPQTPGERYDLTIAPRLVTLKSATAAGLFYGAQTVRQLLPYWAEYDAVAFLQPRAATLPPLHIRDSPRYEWRGAMLDVARHFFSVAEVERYIDLLALLKINRLHLHLADDQGWRIEIRNWPKLTALGGRTEVGGTPGGFYTQVEFTALVSYAADRFITIVPEIDVPGHTNAALASYPELNCSGQAPPPYTGIDVGFSSLCVGKEITYTFLDEVIGQIAALTGGPYFHAGGDEVKTLTPDQYHGFVERVQQIVHAHGKEMIGWDEVATASLLPTSIVQLWRPTASSAVLAHAPRLILSPGNRAYLDMKYGADTALGLDWAGLIPLKTAYDWDPASFATGASVILGVEAPLWSETATTMRDVEFLAMPRLAALAEVAWSAQPTRDWDGFRVRLGAQAPRWAALGINFYRAPDVPWK